MVGRVKPYTERGISRVPCARCGAKSRFQWQICATGNRWCGICKDCDVELNRHMLTWMRIPEAERLADEYAARVHEAAE